jgi:hypothetical protein
VKVSFPLRPHRQQQIICQTQQRKLLCGAVGMIADTLSLKPARLCIDRCYIGNPMIRINTKLLTVALGLIMSATAQAAPKKNPPPPPPPPIPIPSLPFTISAPGTYVLTSNMTAPITPYKVGAINIPTGIIGPVIVDLQGFAITGPGPFLSSGVTDCIIIGSVGSGVTNPYPVTIRNGTINNFGLAIESTVPDNLATVTLSNITIDNIVFNLPVATGVAGVWFNNTSSSIVSNCTFNGIANDVNDVTYGIVDHFSRGGNSYNNNTFSNMFYPIVIQSAAPIPLPSNTSHLVLNNCQFAPPPTP